MVKFNFASDMEAYLKEVCIITKQKNERKSFPLTLLLQNLVVREKEKSKVNIIKKYNLILEIILT